MSYTTLERIKIRLRQFKTETVTNPDGTTTETIVFDHLEENPILEELIAKAESDIISYRHYPDSYDSDMIADDMKKYSNIVIELVLFDYSVEGMDFETNHSENGVNQTFIKRNSILGKVFPFVKVL